MKKIIWLFQDKNITFEVNWLEFIILKNIYKKQKYKINQTKFKGKDYNYVLIDEGCELK